MKTRKEQIIEILELSFTGYVDGYFELVAEQIDTIPEDSPYIFNLEMKGDNISKETTDGWHVPDWSEVPKILNDCPYRSNGFCTFKPILSQ